MARWGGDEFTVLLAGSPPDAAVTELVAHISDRLAQPMSTDGISTEIGVTIGVSRARVAEAEAHDLIRNADQSMYSRKPTR